MNNSSALEVLHGIGYLTGVGVVVIDIQSGAFVLQVLIETPARSQLLHLRKCVCECVCVHVYGGDYGVWQMRVLVMYVHVYADNILDKLKWNVLTSSGILNRS